MNKYKLLIPTLFLFSCTNPEKKPADHAGPATVLGNCFRYINNRDTVTLKLVVVGENISGELVYDYFEKDRNVGSIQGTIKDSILIAEYLYMSEGTQNKRPVIFKKTGDSYTEGSGEMEMVGEKLQFHNPDSLDYSAGIVLKPVDCNE
jgi:hypothetical protein